MGSEGCAGSGSEGSEGGAEREAALEQALEQALVPKAALKLAKLAKLAAAA